MLTIMTNVAMNNKAGVIGGVAAMVIITLSIPSGETFLYVFARVFEMLGMETMPSSNAKRSDIVQAVRFEEAEGLISFCRSIQSASPVDSAAVPEPWDMPGYTSQVIMAAGAFVQGSSIELSADAPIRKPYTAYVQGGLTYEHCSLAAMLVLTDLIKKGIAKL